MNIIYDNIKIAYIKLMFGIIFKFLNLQGLVGIASMLAEKNTRML